jgi:2-phosphosulfolactate phosphatase
VETKRTSDVGTSPFEQWPVEAQIHVEWGPHGARLGGDRGDLIVVVDVLAFSTSVALTVEQGGTALSYSTDELDAMGGRDRAAATLDAAIVSKDRADATARFSLSPASLATIGPGDRLVFTSLNGAACASAASNAPYVVVGALTNRSAVAHAVRSMVSGRIADRCTIVACGERWTSVSDEPDSLRPSIEDLIGAGGIVAALSGLRTSPEADVAAASFTSSEHRILDVLRSCVGGRELIHRGFSDDVDLAAAVDSTTAVPCWRTSNPSREFTAFAIPRVRVEGDR